MARILVADDDVDIRELVEFKLSTLGHDITAVSYTHLTLPTNREV